MLSTEYLILMCITCVLWVLWIIWTMFCGKTWSCSPFYPLIHI